MALDQSCTKPITCFFCIMKEPDSSIRRAAMNQYLKGILSLDDEELILVVSGLWNLAMTQPDNDELPSLGIFECLTSLINKALQDTKWLHKNQNIFIPYYAAHIMGSYTMNKVDLAVRAVDSGVIPPLMELLRGKMSWVEQRVAIRALGHLASYETTFKAVAAYEDEVVKLAILLATSCLEEVYRVFVGVERRKRVSYHCDLLTRGVGGAETENRKAEEWASQLQCWSIHLLNCFAIKERCLDLMCGQDFLKDLSEMWGGLVNDTSASGVGLIRILCYSEVGRDNISKCRYVVENLCNRSRSSDDWQYMAIDCLLLLLNDPGSRYRVIGLATSYLVDLVELRRLGNRTNVGEAITRALVLYDSIERRRREKDIMSSQLQGKRVMAKRIRQEGNRKLLRGEIEEAVFKYSECLEICPLKQRNQRMVVYSNRARCYLMLRDPDSAISDATRALCLCRPPNCHASSLWTRSQAYDMKGMGRESLMDCIVLLNVCMKSGHRLRSIPYCAVRMMSKQMGSTWLFRDASLKARESSENGKSSSSRGNQEQNKNYYYYISSGNQV